jgi:hypothetical protein
MAAFADRTGLSGRHAPRRYLWTDAYAVCNYLSLSALTGDDEYLDLAVNLVNQVHDVLGRHRADDERSGWISGLGDAAGRAHPTRGGLRIGKPLPERRADERYDERTEWDRDGQYYHYLTKWMHALLKVGIATGEETYHAWATELAIAAYRGFRTQSGPPRLLWKMSIDLSRPQVPATGQHDALDGLVTALTLHAMRPDSTVNVLDGLIESLFELCHEARWETDDALGIGGLLFDAARLAQLPSRSSHPLISRACALLPGVLAAADLGCREFQRSRLLQQPASHRLPFREFGLSIGVHAVDLLYRCGLGTDLVLLLDRLHAHAGMATTIETFWLSPRQQTTDHWLAHEDINAVMLATSLAPGAFLEL